MTKLYRYVAISIIVMYLVIFTLFFTTAAFTTDLLILSLICSLFFIAVVIAALFGNLKSEHVRYTNSKINEVMRWQPFETSILPKYPEGILVTNSFKDIYEAVFIKDKKAFKQFCDKKKNEEVQPTEKFPVLYIQDTYGSWVTGDEKFTHYKLYQL